MTARRTTLTDSTAQTALPQDPFEQACALNENYSGNRNPRREGEVRVTYKGPPRACSGVFDDRGEFVNFVIKSSGSIVLPGVTVAGYEAVTPPASRENAGYAGPRKGVLPDPAGRCRSLRSPVKRYGPRSRPTGDSRPPLPEDYV
jgi:hypothetical protein